MDLSVVIPSNSGFAKTAPLLANLSEQKGLDYEVIVVSNPPDVFLADRIQALGSRFHYLSTSEIGANRARNLGLEAAIGEVVVFLDDDCRVEDRHFLAGHLSAHRSNSVVTGLGGPYLLPASKGIFEKTYHSRQMAWVGYPGGESRFPTYRLLGGNCSFKKSRIRGERFDEDFVFGGTEAEFLERLSSRGHRFMFFSELPVFHDLRIGIRGLLKKAFAQGKGAARIEKIRRIRWNPASSIVASETGFKRRVADGLYDIAFQIGYRSQGQDSPLLYELFKEFILRIRRIRFHRRVSEIYWSIRGLLDLDSSR